MAGGPAGMLACIHASRLTRSLTARHTHCTHAQMVKTRTLPRTPSPFLTQQLQKLGCKGAKRRVVAMITCVHACKSNSFVHFSCGRQLSPLSWMTLLSFMTARQTRETAILKACTPVNRNALSGAPRALAHKSSYPDDGIDLELRAFLLMQPT